MFCAAGVATSSGDRRPASRFDSVNSRYRIRSVSEGRRTASPLRHWGRVWRLVTPHKSRVLVLAAGSFFGGAVEAAFLVVITRTALAVADGDDSFGVLAGLYMSVGAAIAVAGALLIGRLGLALLCVRASTSLTVQVAATAHADLADAYLRSSWATQQAEPSGRLQELLIAFAGAAAGVVSSFCNALIGALNLAALIIASVLINPIATLVVVAALPGAWNLARSVAHADQGAVGDGGGGTDVVRDVRVRARRPGHGDAGVRRA